jgi:hypothetical protein
MAWALAARNDVPEDVDVSRTVGCLSTWAPALHHVMPGESPKDAVSRTQREIRALPAGGVQYAWLAEFRDPSLRAMLTPDPLQFDYLGYLGHAPNERPQALSIRLGTRFAIASEIAYHTSDADAANTPAFMVHSRVQGEQAFLVFTWNAAHCRAETGKKFFAAALRNLDSLTPASAPP